MVRAMMINAHDGKLKSSCNFNVGEKTTDTT